MKDAQASGANAPASQAQASPPRQKPSTLASIAIQSFATFRSQTSSNPVPIAVAQSPLKRKPLPANSPVVGHFTASQSIKSSATVQNKESALPYQGPRRSNAVLSPPLTEDDLFVPRNLDE